MRRTRRRRSRMRRRRGGGEEEVESKLRSWKFDDRLKKNMDCIRFDA